MPSSEKEKLVDDLLRDANYEAFRAEVRELSLAEFQFKRRSRFLPMWLGLAASLAIAGTLLFFGATKGKKPDSTVPRAEAIAFHEDQVPVISLIQTIQLDPVEIVRSLPDRSLIVRSPNLPGAGIELAHSDASSVDRLNDAELLSLFPNETIGFVTTSRGKRLVVFTEPEARLEFRMGKTAVR
jgi:hypothetical protein